MKKTIEEMKETLEKSMDQNIEAQKKLVDEYREKIASILPFEVLSRSRAFVADMELLKKKYDTLYEQRVMLDMMED